jgi:hypothetical protein
MNQITTSRPTRAADRQQETGDPAPSACDIALEGMIVLLARHISREMSSVDEPQAREVKNKTLEDGKVPTTKAMR